MKVYILVRVVVPLSLLSLVSLYVQTKYQFDGFFMNLSSEMIGIVITVAYVDWVLEKRDKIEWNEASQKIHSRMRLFVDSSLTSIRISLGYKFTILNSVNNSGSDPNELFRVTETIIKSESRARCALMNDSGWLTFTEQLKLILDEGDKMLAIFAHNLSPDQYTHLIDVRENAQSILALISTLSNINKYEEEESTIMREKIYDHIAQKIATVIDSLRTLKMSEN